MRNTVGLLFVVGLLVASCGGDSGDSASPSGSEPIISVAESADGFLTVSVPASEGVTPTIEVSPAPASDFVGDGSDLQVYIYEVGPAGSTFTDPATITFTLPTPDGPTVGFAIISEQDGDGYEALQDASTTFADGVATISGAVSHFSRVVAVLDTGDPLSMDPNPTSAPVGSVAKSTVVGIQPDQLVGDGVHEFRCEEVGSAIREARVGHIIGSAGQVVLGSGLDAAVLPLEIINDYRLDVEVICFDDQDTIPPDEPATNTAQTALIDVGTDCQTFTAENKISGNVDCPWNELAVAVFFDFGLVGLDPPPGFETALSISWEPNLFLDVVVDATRDGDPVGTATVNYYRTDAPAVVLDIHAFEYEGITLYGVDLAEVGVPVDWEPITDDFAAVDVQLRVATEPAGVERIVARTRAWDDLGPLAEQDEAFKNQSIDRDRVREQLGEGYWQIVDIAGVLSDD